MTTAPLASRVRKTASVLTFGRNQLNVVAHYHGSDYVCDHCGVLSPHTILVSEMEDNDPDRQVFPMCQPCLISHINLFKRELN